MRVCFFSCSVQGSPADRSVDFHQVGANEWDESRRVNPVKYCSPQQSSCLQVWQHPPAPTWFTTICPVTINYRALKHLAPWTFPQQGYGHTCQSLDHAVLLCVCVSSGFMHVRKRELMLERQGVTEASCYSFCVIVDISPWQFVCVWPLQKKNWCCDYIGCCVSVAHLEKHFVTSLGFNFQGRHTFGWNV